MNRIMKSIAAIHKSYGNPVEVVNPEEIDVSAPLKGQALVKLLRAVVNPSDLGMIGGSYGRLRQLPAIGGREGIGEVVEIGAGVENVKVGTRVRIPEEPGVWTQYQICDASNLMVVPNDISEDLEAMSFINPPTAYCILNQFTDLKEGDWVIQNGASSALGQAAFGAESDRRRKRLEYDKSCGGLRDNRHCRRHGWDPHTLPHAFPNLQRFAP